jgi:hypothetical protein
LREAKELLQASVRLKKQATQALRPSKWQNR